MKIIHQGGYSSSELQLYRLTIYKNLVDCAKALIAAMKQFDVTPENADNEEYSKMIVDYNLDPDPNTYLDPKIADAVTSLWNDPAKPQVMEHQSDFYLMDSAK